MLREYSLFLPLLRISSSGLHSSCVCLGRARTYESKPIPGSREHLDPDAWAARLFKLKQKQLNVPFEDKEPPLMHMICRLKPVKGVPHYQRAILEKYGIGQGVKNHTWILVKNVPSVNKELDVIKHLIRIQQVEFPQGLPQPDDDLLKCRLLPDGRFLRHSTSVVKGELLAQQTSVPTCSKDAAPDNLFPHVQTGTNAYLTRSYLRQFNNRKWSRFELFREFFTSRYQYRLNQDGLEYRYSRLWRLDDAMFHAIRTQRNPDGTLKPPNQNRFEANWSTYPWSKF